MNTLRCTGLVLSVAGFAPNIACAADLRALQDFFVGQAIRPTLSAEIIPAPRLGPKPVSPTQKSKPATYTPDERIVIAFQSASEAD